ncbi:MAG TPA: isoleucine--tRNA ligase [Caulobacteraceae bacterium]
MADDAAPRDYRDTVFLPDTSFPMRAGLPQKEPAILGDWARQDIYNTMRKARQEAGAPLFVLHDGPPYANGPIHIGHSLNKLLKDFVVRSRFALGYDVDYVPGWDCHGLPIEWKIEEEFRKEGRAKDQVPPAEFRARCREYAGHWIVEQAKGFQRLGVLGDWEHRYSTMDFSSEATIVAEFHKFMMSGQLYRGSKPVMWSPVERTALADAEVEYHDHVSPTIWVKFPVRRVQAEGNQRLDLWLGGGDMPRPSVVIWTTTPWTIPGNRAIAYGANISYGLYEVEELAPSEFSPWAHVGERLIVADKLWPEVAKAALIGKWRRIATLDDPTQIYACAHPLYQLDDGYDFDVPVLEGDHVTEDAGTGFVHTAPSHGQEDYQVWLDHGYSRADIPDMVDPDGAYYAHVPLFGGLKVLETEGKKAGKFGPANNAVIEKLIEAGALLARGRLEHSYPHSWRSKAPVIFRNTPQWFIRMDSPLPPLHGEGQTAQPSGWGSNQADSPTPATAHADAAPPHEGEGKTLRELCLQSIDATTYYPPSGQVRIRNMVEGRPDWLISRQRHWGTPLAMFVDKDSGQPLCDPAVNARIVELIAREGADAWYERPAADFLGDHDPARYEKVEDILDVWFDSGCTHVFTIEGRENSRWPADLYLEGSDQHRGWFQSSLLESCGSRGRAPYDQVITHGFTLDENGQKMSKSLGNTVDPHTVIGQSGAEILRLWTAMVDYQEDQRIGPTILATTTDAYRKLRNTLRYLLGALAGFTDAERVPLAEMPPLERYILHRLWRLDGQVRAAYEAYAFSDVIRPLIEFCQGDLSTLFFDVRKDALYCDRPDSLRRRAARTVMDAVFERLTVWLSPLLAFTCEEAWTTRFPDAGSNLLRVFPDTPAKWRNDAEAARWEKVEEVTGAVTAALEIERREKRIGSALEAAPKVSTEHTGAFEGLDAAEIFRTSGATLKAGELTVRPFKAEGEKCARCWRILPEVKEPSRLCLRCEDAVAHLDQNRASSAA